MMIDWVSAKIPLSHDQPIHGGLFVSYSSDGEIEFRTYKRLTLEGSYSDKITIRTLSTGKEGEIYFSGNPNKFLLGHNLFGSWDLLPLMRNALECVFRDLEIQPTEENWAAIEEGHYSLSRIDLNEMIEMQSLGDVLAWIRATGHTSRSRHKSSGILKGDTLYWGKTSRRWAMKVYAKGQEITRSGHELPTHLPLRDFLIEWAQNKLRWELVLRGPELKKRGLANAAAFVRIDPQKLFDSYKQNILMPENKDLPTSILTGLPRNLRSTYVLWKSGEDLRRTLSKNTYYAHRRRLLAHNIDISIFP